MPTLEQQLADAIASQNALTQAVASYKSQLDSAVAAMKAQTAEALKVNRIYSDGVISRVRSLLHRSDCANGQNGVYKIKTPMSMSSGVMAKFDIKGYDYGESKIIDLSFVTYLYGGNNGADGKPGASINNSAQRYGNSTKTGIWLGKDPATGNFTFCFGTPKAPNYFTAWALDFMHHTGAPSLDAKDWSVELDNSDAPAANATTGFGLVNLLAL